MQMNSRPAQRPPLEEELRWRLQEDFAPEVDRLGDLLGRDLSHWSNPKSPKAAPVPVPSRAATHLPAPERLAATTGKVPAGAPPEGATISSNS
jgi:hypothetical protein